MAFGRAAFAGLVAGLVLGMAPAATAGAPVASSEAAAAGVEIRTGQWAVIRPVDGGLEVVSRGGGGGPETVEPGTISLSVGNGGGGVLMTVRSGMPGPMNYQATMFQGSGSARTSVCTLLPGVAAFEQWQQPLTAIVVSNFTPAQSMGCF